MAAYEVLLLNTTLPQIQAAQSGDTYVVPRDITFSTNATFTTGTANGVMYLNGDKVVSTGSLLTFNGTTFTAPSLSLTNALSTTSGGTGLSSFTAGDLTYYSTGTALSKLAIGTANQVLTSSGTAPQWTSLSSIGVTSVSFGSTGLTPSSATAGAVSVAGTLVTSNGGTGLSSYTAGDLVYYSTGTALSKLAIGTASQILTSSGSAPQWSTASGISVGTATNLAGGAAGSVPYQSGAGATTFLSIGAANRVLTSTGSAPQWVTSLTGLTGVSSSSITNTALTSGRVVYSTTGGAQTDSASLTFDGTTFATTTVDTTNLEVTNIKAKDGTAAASIADSTGIISITSNPILSGGTANGVLYLNGSKVATSGSALTFDGTNLTVGGTASATKLIPTGGAATGNGMYLPAANTLAWSNNGSETMRLDSSGNLGLGVTPSAFNTGRAIEVGAVGNAFWALSNDVYLTANTFYQSAYKYAASGIAASMYEQVSGSHRWHTAPSGTAGNTITFTQAMTLDSSGKLLINATTSPSAATVKAAIQGASGADSYYQFGNGSGGGGLIGSVVSGGIQMYTYTGAFGSETYTERMRLDSSGNLGLGVTPSASTTPTLQIQGGLTLSNGGGAPSIAGNAIRGANWTYLTSANASLYQMFSGQHVWYNAPSGTAGNAITFTQAMTLDASGNLLVGTTSSTYNSAGRGVIELNGSSDNIFAMKVAGAQNFYVQSNATNTAVWNVANTYMSFGTNNTERARITSGGYFKASNDGTYSGSTSAWHEFYQSANDIALIARSSNASLTSHVFAVSADRNTTNTSYYFIRCDVVGVAYRFQVADSGNVTNTNGSYGTISDAKMKTDIVDAGSQWADIKAVRFRKFKMKDDPEQIVQLGVVAQELEQTSPGLVEEHADYEEVEITDEEGNVKKERQPTGTTTKSVKTSVLLMKAAVALQEAMARIEQLEAKVAALESKGV